MKPDRKEARASQIEQVAFDLLDKRGAAGLSMRAVAKAARASNETLYRWYGDRTGLLEALIDRQAALLDVAMSEPQHSDPLDQLRDVATILLIQLLEQPAIALSRAAAADTTGTLGRALARESRDRIAPRLVSLMARAVDNGDLAGGTPQEMAEIFFALLVGDLQMRRATGALQNPRKEFVKAHAGQAVAQLGKLFSPT